MKRKENGENIAAVLRPSARRTSSRASRVDSASVDVAARSGAASSRFAPRRAERCKECQLQLWRESPWLQRGEQPFPRRRRNTDEPEKTIIGRPAQRLRSSAPPCEDESTPLGRSKLLRGLSPVVPPVCRSSRARLRAAAAKAKKLCPASAGKTRRQRKESLPSVAEPGALRAQPRVEEEQPVQHASALMSAEKKRSPLAPGQTGRGQLSATRNVHTVHTA